MILLKDIIIAILLLILLITEPFSNKGGKYNENSKELPEWLYDADCFPEDLTKAEKINQYSVIDQEVLLLFDERSVVLDCEYDEEHFTEELERIESLENYLRFDDGELFEHLTYIHFSPFYRKEAGTSLYFHDIDYVCVLPEERRMVYVYAYEIESYKMSISNEFLPKKAPDYSDSSTYIWLRQQHGDFEPRTQE